MLSSSYGFQLSSSSWVSSKAEVVSGSCSSFTVLRDCKVFQREDRCPSDCPYFVVRRSPAPGRINSLSRKERYAFQRLITGLSIGGHRDAYFRFMTLTSAPDSPKDINKSFDLLKKRIQRANPHSIAQVNRRYHINLPKFEGFRFNKYYKLKTAEGNNVLHIVYWGLKSHFIPQEWLKWNWDQIHGAFKADIRIVWRRHRTRKARINGLVGYLLTNYLTKQPILRMSYGWKWAWLGFCKSWQHVKREMSLLRRTPTEKRQMGTYFSAKFRYRNVTLEYWRSLMQFPLLTSRQTKFCCPDRSKYSRKFDWIISKVKHKLIPKSVRCVLVKTKQTYLCDVDRIFCNHHFWFPEDWQYRDRIEMCMNQSRLSDHARLTALGW